MTDTFESTEQRASYGIGRQMGDQLAKAPFSDFSVDAAIEGFLDGIKSQELKVPAEQINEAFRAIQERISEEEAGKKAEMTAEGQAYLDKNAERDEVTVTESGLQYEVLVEGSGEKPAATSNVRVHYHGTLIDGTVFDSSVQRGQPAEFPVNGVIKGWIEALQLMPAGSKWRLTIPYDLAYGEQGAGGAIGPYATLIFEVELIEIL